MYLRKSRTSTDQWWQPMCWNPTAVQIPSDWTQRSWWTKVFTGKFPKESTSLSHIHSVGSTSALGTFQEVEFALWSQMTWIRKRIGTPSSRKTLIWHTLRSWRTKTLLRMVQRVLSTFRMDTITWIRKHFWLTSMESWILRTKNRMWSKSCLKMRYCF